MRPGDRIPSARGVAVIVGKRHRLAPLLAPRSIAFVGASTKTGTPGNHMIVEARRGGFAGAIYPVNPKYDEVEGLACYRSLAELPEAVDLAVLSEGIFFTNR